MDLSLAGRRVVVTGASRDFGRAIALRFAQLGAEVVASARSLEGARRTEAEIRGLGHEQVHALACDLSSAASIREFAAQLGKRCPSVDVLVHNAARYLDGPELTDAEDADIADTLASGATGTVLLTKHLLPLLRASENPDIVTLASTCAVPREHRSSAHASFYAAKSAQAGLADVLSARLRPHGVRVISLFPPDFADGDPLSGRWDAAERTAGGPLTAQSVAECVLFAVTRPRDCFIRAIHFEQAPPP